MTEQPMVLEINCTTGEVIERPFTQEEIEIQEKVAIEVAEREAKNRVTQDARISAQAKLAALGLTPEEIAAL